MTTYEICNTASGLDLGSYTAPTAAAALEQLASDAGITAEDLNTAELLITEA